MRYTGPSCRICAIPLNSSYAEICSQCLKKAPPFSKVINYSIYDGVLAEAINLLKFHGLKRLAKPLSRLMIDFDLHGLEGVVPVPLSRKRLIERGFNQSLLFAKTISKEKKIPLLMDNLLKVKETAPQTGLSGKERISNIKGAFTVKGDIRGLRLLLVDDVMTTGATVTECSKKLIEAGAEEVVVLTLARTSML